MKKNFLLVDDDADDAQLFCEILCEIGTEMRCFKVENGREVFDFLSEHKDPKPDFIFLDINMPLMDGWECLRKLKGDRDHTSIPVIMYSTSSAKKDVEMAYRLGASLFLSKPEDLKELRQILEILANNSSGTVSERLRGFESVKMA